MKKMKMTLVNKSRILLLLTVVLCYGSLSQPVCGIDPSSPDLSVNELIDLWEGGGLASARRKLKDPLITKISDEEIVELFEFRVKDKMAWFKGKWVREGSDSVTYGNVYVVPKASFLSFVKGSSVGELEKEVPALKVELDKLRSLGEMQNPILSGIDYRFKYITRLDKNTTIFSQWTMRIDTLARHGLDNVEFLNSLYGDISIHAGK